MSTGVLEYCDRHACLHACMSVCNCACVIFIRVVQGRLHGPAGARCQARVLHTHVLQVQLPRGPTGPSSIYSVLFFLYPHCSLSLLYFCLPSAVLSCAFHFSSPLCTFKINCACRPLIPCCSPVLPNSQLRPSGMNLRRRRSWELPAQM